MKEKFVFRKLVWIGHPLKSFTLNTTYNRIFDCSVSCPFDFIITHKTVMFMFSTFTRRLISIVPVVGTICFFIIT